MKLKQEKTDATKKKGMALSDDALENVTGGKTYYAVKWDLPVGKPGRTQLSVVSSQSEVDELLRYAKSATVAEFDCGGNLMRALDFFASHEDNLCLTWRRVSYSDWLP